MMVLYFLLLTNLKDDTPSSRDAGLQGSEEQECVSLFKRYLLGAERFRGPRILLKLRLSEWCRQP